MHVILACMGLVVTDIPRQLPLGIFDLSNKQHQYLAWVVHGGQALGRLVRGMRQAAEVEVHQALHVPEDQGAGSWTRQKQPWRKKFTQLSSLNFNGCQFFPTVHFKFHGKPRLHQAPSTQYTSPRGVQGGPEKVRIRFRTAGSSRFQLRENPGFRFHFFEEKSQLGDCLCCVGGCLPADRPAELWAKIGCVGRLDRKERCKNTKHFFSFAALSRKVCFQETFVGFYIK